MAIYVAVCRTTTIHWLYDWQTRKPEVIFVIGLVVVVFLLAVIATIGMVIVTIAFYAIASFVVFMVGGWIGTGVAVSTGGDAQLGFVVGGAGAVALLWLGVARFGGVGKAGQKARND